MCEWVCVCVEVGHMLSNVNANHLHKSLIITSMNGVFLIRNWSVLGSSRWIARRMDCLHAMLICQSKEKKRMRSELEENRKK